MVNELWPHRVLATGPASARERISEPCSRNWSSICPEKEFQKCVARHHGDSNFRGFSCWDQLLAMAFAQLTYRESLRDIESCLRALQSKLYHMGFRGKVSRSTLADANESHDWRIFADFCPGVDCDRPPVARL